MKEKYFNLKDLLIANITIYKFVEIDNYKYSIKSLLYRQIYLKINNGYSKGFIDIFGNKYIKEIEEYYKNPQESTIDYSNMNIDLSIKEKQVGKISYNRLKEIYFELNNINKEKIKKSNKVLYLKDYRKEEIK